MKVVGYLRVSTGTQVEHGLGLDVQEQAIRKWARAGKHRLLTLHRDEGVSGSNGLDSRVGLYDALTALEEGPAEGLIVYRLDRLARDLVLQESLLAQIWRRGGEVFSTFPSEADYLRDDPDDPSRKLIRQVLGAVSEYERAMVKLRLRLGRERKKALGGHAVGAPPFGYRAEGRELVPDEREQQILARMAELRRNGASIRAISDALNVEGLGPKRGAMWHPQTVARVLARA